MDDPAWLGDATAAWRRAAAAAPLAATAATSAGVPASGGLPAAPSLSLRYVPDLPGRASALAIEPYAVLVNKAKARAAGVTSHTLAGLAARGLRLCLPINLSPDNGDTGWIHPLFAEYTGWPGRSVTEPPELFLDLAALDGMKRLRDSLLGSCELVAVSSSQALLAELLDPARPGRAAAWGNPLQLSARLVQQGRTGPEFEMISLQRFMGLSTPSLFRASAQFPPPGQQQTVPADASLLAELPHDRAFYARLPLLSCLADTPLMSSLALNLLRPAAPDVESGGSGEFGESRDCDHDTAGRVYLAAASAHYEMARHVHRLRGATPVSRPAPPTLNPA